MIKYVLLVLATSVSACFNSDHKPHRDIKSKADQPLPVTGISKGADVVYLSKDAGKTWQPFSAGIPPDATVSCFLEKGDKIFAATEFHGVFMADGAGIWQSVGAMLPKDIHLKAIEAAGDKLVIGSSNYGVWTSPDGGKTWMQQAGELRGIPVRCMTSCGDKLFAGTDKGIYVSPDQGVQWKHCYGAVQVTGFTEFQHDLYAGLMNGAVVSADGGVHWTYVYQPLTLHDISHDDTFVYAMTLGAGLLKSKDKGKTWQYANTGMGTHNLYTFEVKHIGAEIFAAQWTGIYYSNDEAESWTLLEGGLPDSTAFCTLEWTKLGLLGGIGLRGK